MLLLRNRKKFTVLLVCCLLIFVLNNCINKPDTIPDFRGDEYAGSIKCRNCHQEIYDDYLLTAHNRTSSPASLKTIKGSFAQDSNFVQYRPEVKVVMEHTDTGFYQVAYLDGVKKQSAKFDMVMGSGRKGQSYLSWLNNTAFQLPVSYFVNGKSWINSPGYPPKFVLFNRNIPIGCFQCHSSYIKRIASQPSNNYLIDYFDSRQIIYGIDCERCHGPLAAHVKYQEDNPGIKIAKFVTVIKNLDRQQKIDMCAICHSGTMLTATPSFEYKPGDKLAEYIHPDTSKLQVQDIDVHGKQDQLLSASKCFIKSKTLTCLSCHDPHAQEKNNLIAYSQKCISCHENANHEPGTIETLDNNLINCIDCHMPEKSSAAITMKSSSLRDSISAPVRTHYISIYK